jgi:putative cell wall-binding protein
MAQISLASTPRRIAAAAVALAALILPAASPAPASAATFSVVITAANTDHRTYVDSDGFDIPRNTTTIRLVEPPSMAGDSFDSLSAGIDHGEVGMPETIDASMTRANGILTIQVPISGWNTLTVGEELRFWVSGQGNDGLFLRWTGHAVAPSGSTLTKTMDPAVLDEMWLNDLDLSNVRRGDTISVTGTPGWFTTSPSGTTSLPPVSGWFGGGGPDPAVAVSANGATATITAPAPSRFSAAMSGDLDPTLHLSAQDDLDENFKYVSVSLRLDYADTNPTISRASGPDRYAAASAISKEAYPDGAPIVFIASGTTFPDALSAAPVAALQGGPLLITLPDRLPASIAEELERLSPSKIVVVGGVNSVSAAVMTQLKAMVPDTRRIAGADRYEVARNLVSYAWGTTGTDAAYIATGDGFPDALAASAAAGSRGIPVVLVYGKASSVDDATMTMLEGLGVSEPIIAGGPASVSAGIADDLGSLTGGVPVERLSGDNRYTASLAIARSAFDTADEVFLATGANFPDALAGAAWAGSVSGPLYTLPGNCVLDGVLKDIERYHLSSITLLGGTASLTPAVQTLTPCGWGDFDERGGGEG